MSVASVALSLLLNEDVIVPIVLLSACLVLFSVWVDKQFSSWPTATSFSKAHALSLTFRQSVCDVLAFLTEWISTFEIYHFTRPQASRKPGKNSVLVSSKKHIKELSDAPELSQRAAYADLLGLKENLNNLSVDERTSSTTRLQGLVLQRIGPPQFSDLQPRLQTRLEEALSEALIRGKATDGRASMSLNTTGRKILFSMTSVLFFGDALAAEPDFVSALASYPRDMVYSSVALQLVPKWMAPFIHAIVTRRGHAMHSLLRRLLPVVLQYQERTKSLPLSPNQPTVLNWCLESTKDKSFWEPMRLLRAILGMWFAASHTLWMSLVFILHELCARPEYVELLRAEVDGHTLENQHNLETLPLLDSFMKEVLRMHPLDTINVRRKALEPFTFSGGPHVPVGKTACVSSYDILNDPTIYPNPAEFDGYRFMPTSTGTVNENGNSRSPSNGKRFTDVTESYLIWGYGSQACPGRYLASFLLKLVVIHIVMHYDICLERPNAAKTWAWKTTTLPRESTRIIIRPRDGNT